MGNNFQPLNSSWAKLKEPRPRNSSDKLQAQALSVPGAPPLPGEQWSVGSDDPLAHSGLQPGHILHRQTSWTPWSFRTRVGSPKCLLLFILSFHWRRGSWAPDSHGTVTAGTVTLAMVAFSGYWVCIQGVCVVSTARDSYCLVHHLLEGTCFLDVGSGWVLVHQILKSLGGRELGYNIVEVSI